jgi:hypothetical protein
VAEQQRGGTVNPPGSNAVQGFARKLNEWAHTLDERNQAMLVDLLAKAGGDVYGHDAANTIGADQNEVSSSELSPLELRDYTNAVLGIFGAAESGNA